jgi:septal ring factor EnvC (AmiA/AmiB activator)
LNNDIKTLKEEIIVIKKKNEELELDNTDSRARIKATEVDHENKLILLVIID